MSYHKQDYVVHRVRELAVLIRQLDRQDEALTVEDEALASIDQHYPVVIQPTELDKLLRMLRPASSHMQEYSNAVKLRCRQLILNHVQVSSEGPLLLSRFDKQCEALKKINPSLLVSFLSFLKPLSFYERIKRVAVLSHQNNVIEVVEGLQTEKPSLSLTTKNSLNKGLDDADLTAPTKPTTRSVANTQAQGATAINVSLEQLSLHWVTPEVEKKLLIDLVYVLQGVTGKYIRYDNRTESYIIDPSLHLNTTVRDVVMCICELGWLYRRVDAFLTKTSQSQGLIVQAFGFALQEELHDYYRLLAILEQELGQEKGGDVSLLKTKAGGGYASKDNKGVEIIAKTGEEMIHAGLTLLRLKAWMQEPTERMCLMARLVDGVGMLSGGALASRLHAHARHGDVTSSDVVQRIMDSVCHPIYHMLIRWLLHGELHDPYHEFFIASNALSSATNVWKESYLFLHHLLPSFIPKDIAQKILVIGKSINFIKLCQQRIPKKAHHKNNNKTGSRKSFRQINKSKQLTTYGRVVDAQDDNHEDVENNDQNIATETSPAEVEVVTMTEMELILRKLRYGGELQLSEMIYKLSTSINKQLYQLLESQFALKSHLLALKKFMLLGQGDFVTCLMDSIGPELKKRANQLFRHNLTSILEGSLRASNAQYESPMILDRVGVRLLEASSGDSGWEVFSLDYQVDLPLNAIVHTEAMAKYRIAFHMLWRLKRVEWSLASTWKQFLSFSHTLEPPRSRGRGAAAASKDGGKTTGAAAGKPTAAAGNGGAIHAVYPPNHMHDLKAIFHRCHLNRARMMHVINNLCAFLMFEVLETAWIHLEEKLHRATCLDDAIAAHDAYLTEILERALLSAQHEALNIQIQQLLQIMLRFCHLEETLIAGNIL